MMVGASKVSSLIKKNDLDDWHRGESWYTDAICSFGSKSLQVTIRLVVALLTRKIKNRDSMY